MGKKRILFRGRVFCAMAGWFLVNVLAYYGGRFLTRGRVFFDFTTTLDRMIPIWSPAVVIYILTFAYWLVGFFLLAKAERYDILAGELAAKILSLVIFVLVPTQKGLPEIDGTGLFDWGLRLIYQLDEPNMLLPSIHCLDSYVLFRGCLESKQRSALEKTAIGILMASIFASTLLTGQHVLADIPSAIMVAEIGFALERKWSLGAKYEKFLRKIEDTL